MWSAEYQACWVLRSPCQEPKRESVSIGLIRPAGSHVTAADHLGIVAMDRNGGMVSTAKMCTVARMIDIAVGQDDEAQIVRPATCCSKFGVELVPLVREARVDEDVAALNINEIAVHAEVDPADSADHAVDLLA